MAGLILLIVLCIVMATASFLAGALPLAVTLTPSQLRLISSVGVGVLVGTSLIVIIPEGIEAVSSQALASAQHNGQHAARGLLRRLPSSLALEARQLIRAAEASSVILSDESNIKSSVEKTLREVTGMSVETEEEHDHQTAHGWHDTHNSETKGTFSKSENPEDSEKDKTPDAGAGSSPEQKHEDDEHDHSVQLPGTEIGLALVLGFILMFLIDRLPQHASESLHTEPQTQQFSMDSLAVDGASAGDEEAQGFLGSLAPTAKSARSFATTVGLVIHAAADGIALGASSSSSDMKLGFIIFFAIMIHKAPAAFGLTSVLLKQGLSKRMARAHLIIFSLAAPVGALTTWLLLALLGGGNMDGPSGHWWTGMLLLFSGGTFLYVAMHAMQENGSHGSPAANGSANYGDSAARKAETTTMRDTMATTVGMLLPLLTQLGHHHH